MQKRKVLKGKRGWTFIVRDLGQQISLKYYEKPATKNPLLSLQEGRFITAKMFLILCKESKVRLSKWTRAQLLYINEMEVSITALRHKNTNSNFKRDQFDGIFSAIELVVIRTMEKDTI